MLCYIMLRGKLHYIKRFLLIQLSQKISKIIIDPLFAFAIPQSVECPTMVWKTREPEFKSRYGQEFSFLQLVQTAAWAY
jgi:hypothetical protein